MTRIRLLLGPRPARRPGRRAARRLSAARLRFERSTRVLRKAALDHVEDHALVGLVLAATLARMQARDGVR